MLPGKNWCPIERSRKVRGSDKIKSVKTKGSDRKHKINEKIEGIERELFPKFGEPFFRRADPFYVLVTTILSQRTRDEVTYEVAEKLFRNFGGADQIVNADVKTIEKLIKPVGFYRQKAKRIKQVARIILEKYRGKVPSDEKELLSLPGVGRKTANCVLAYGFGKDAIAVDTHVHRISNRLGIVRTKTPEQSEVELKKILPRRMWKKFNITLVRFGQSVCLPLKPRCWICPLRDTCDYYKATTACC